MIPVNIPEIGEKEKAYLLECLDTGWISSEGPFVSKFEESFASYIGRNFGVAVANGSAALDIAVKSVGITEDDEVIMPTFTIISPAFSIVRQGGKPVLVDSDRLTWNMDVSQIEKKITSRTKAILVVHVYGHPVDMNPVIELCEKYNLYLIEDAAEMHGQTYYNKKCGSFGHLSIFSFYPNKHITTGEGGMILTNDEKLAGKCRELRNLCFNSKRRFVHEDIGWNYRMTNLQAALGVAQLERIESILIKKRNIGKLYNELLEDVEGIQKPLPATAYSDNVYWVYGLVFNDEQHGHHVIQKLSENKIGTRPFFWSMHEQPVFNQQGLFLGESYPVAEQLARCGWYLPSGLGIKEEEIRTVVKFFKKALNKV